MKKLSSRVSLMEAEISRKSGKLLFELLSPPSTVSLGYISLLSP